MASPEWLRHAGQVLLEPLVLTSADKLIKAIRIGLAVATWAVATKPLLSLWSQGVWAWWGTKSRPWALQEETSSCLRSWWRRSPLKFKGRRADQSWQLFKATFPTVQELSILVCRKLSKAEQAQLGKDLLLKLRSKKEMHRQWKWGQVTWGKYRDMVLICRGRVRKAKAKL